VRKAQMEQRRIFFLIVALIVMLVIFSFSAQPSDVSKETSGRIEKVVGAWVEKAEFIQPEKKKEIQENMTFIVRKTAHFTIYTILGICVMGFANTYERRIWEKESVAYGNCHRNGICSFR